MQTITELWQIFESWLRLNRPDILASLNPAAQPDEISRVEAAFGHALPDDMKRSLLIHDGAPHYVDLFGPSYMYMLVPLSELLPDWYSLCQMVLPDERMGTAIGPVKPYMWNKHWLPFFTDNELPYFVDMDPAKGGTVGQVGRCVFVDDTVEIVAGSYTEFFKMKLDEIGVFNAPED